jgi:hypothetical protein
MNQEELARHMNGVVYAQRKLSYLQEKLAEVQAHKAIVLSPGQLTLSVIDVEVAATHELLLNETEAAIATQQEAVQLETSTLLQSLPELIKDFIQKGMPLIASWPMGGIDSLALVYQQETFLIIPHDKLVQ